MYWIPCGSCLKVHLEQTGRTLDHRSKEHRRALVSGNVTQSAVAEHAASEMHSIEWEKAVVVEHPSNYHQRHALETWHTRKEAQAMNREGPLPSVYNPLIKQLHRPR